MGGEDPGGGWVGGGRGPGVGGYRVVGVTGGGWVGVVGVQRWVGRGGGSGGR